VASGLSSPTFVTFAPGDTTRLFITERGGNIKILNLGTGTVTTFMTSTQLSSANGLTSGGERGLLGLAFDPNYATNRRFYVNYTGTNGHTFVRSFVTQAGNPNLVDGNNNAANILNFNQDFSNHNGGWIGFGPDGHLYIATGDGGSGNDPNNRALDRSQWLGKMLRITPNTTSAGGYTIPSSNPFAGDGLATTRDEIWAYGLRNPWRNSFDRQTGDLYIGDVGQNAREEVNFQAAGTAGGVNYGWRQWEGIASTSLSGSSNQGTTPKTNPIFDYPQNSSNGQCVTGGYVYRGPLSVLQGFYFYGDYVGRTLRSFQFNGAPSSSWNGTNVINQIDWTLIAKNSAGTNIRGSWSSFGEDAIGNFYAVDLAGGVIHRFSAATLPVDLTQIQMLSGAIFAGTINDLRTSNNAFLTTSGATRLRQPGIEPKLEMGVWAVYSGASANTMSVSIESRIGAPQGEAEILAMNWNTEQYETIGKYKVTSTESTKKYSGLDASKYINKAGEIELRVRHYIPSTSKSFDSIFDHIQIDVGG